MSAFRCPECGELSDENKLEINGDDRAECSYCEEWFCVLDAETVEDEEEQESDLDRDFRLQRSNLEQAHGLLEAAEGTGEQKRIRDAINRKAFEEIAGFIEADDNNGEWGLRGKDQ